MPRISQRTALLILLLAILLSLTACAAQKLNAEVTRLSREGRYAEAIPKAREALALREQALGPIHPDVATILNDLANLLSNAGDYAEARPLYERALRIREQALGPTHPDVARSLNDLAVQLNATGDYAGARPLLERAIKIKKRALGPAHPDVATSLANLAGLLLHAGDYASAGPLFERVLKIREQALGPTHPDVAVSLNDLAIVFDATGDYAGARPLYERALKIREQALGPTHPDVAHSLNNLAVLLSRTGDYARARPLYERALEIGEQALGPMHPEVAHYLGFLARLLVVSGDYAGARPLAERALKIREQTLGPTHPDVATSLDYLTGLFLMTGDYALARPLAERAVKIHEQVLGPTHPSVAYSLNNLARLLATTGDSARARLLYERGLKIREQALGPTHPDVAQTLNYLVSLLQTTRDYAAARPLSERALTIARVGGQPETLWGSLRVVAMMRERDGQLLEALALYREAVAIIAQLSVQFGGDVARTRYLEGDNRLGVYDALAALLLKLHEQDSTRGYDREALATIEAKKNRIAADALASARPTIQDSQARAKLERARAESDRVSALERALTSERAKAPAQQSSEKLQNLTTLLATTKAEYLGLVRPLLAQYRQHVSLFPDQQVIDPTTPAKFAAWLPAGTAAIGLFPSKDQLYVFVVATGGVFRVKRRAVSQSDLFELVRYYRRLVAEGEHRVLPWEDDGSQIYVDYVAPLKTVTARLSAHLLGPIEEELREYANIIFMPNDLLLYLPFHALQRKNADGTWRFLAETHVVSYLTQMEQAYLRPAAETLGDVPLLAMSNPDGSLKMATREVQALTTIRARTTVLEGSQATKTAFLALLGQTVGTTDLHFATHGVLDAVRPERSYLLMAGSDAKSRKLDVGEIRGLTLRTRLAVLSACETAVAEDTPGAALVTLAAAFSEAGAETIVASLWKVEDASARDTMVAFHSALRNVDRATALQQAQRSVMRQARTGHPFYWAPFLLIGAR